MIRYWSSALAQMHGGKLPARRGVPGGCGLEDAGTRVGSPIDQELIEPRAVDEQPGPVGGTLRKRR